MDRARVVVTGIGLVTSIGIGLPDFAAGLRQGRSGVRPITSFRTEGFEHANGCEVAGFEPEQWIERLPVEELSRASQFSVAAARMAARDAGLSDEDIRNRRALVAVGTTDGGASDMDELAAAWVRDGHAGLPGARVHRYPASRLSSSVVAEFDLHDVEALTIPTACASGNYAIGYGLDALQGGDVDVALCGGADAVCLKTFVGFYRLGTVAPDVCRPFDVGRRGLLTGEGGAILVLERLESALARGARIHAEVLGYGLTCDAHHAVAPDRAGIARTIRAAHRDAGVTPEQIDLISAHGTATPANDVTEVAAIREVFGATPLPPTIGVKSMIGHSMGAASAVAAAACIVAITDGFIPPTTNHVETDPECDVDCVPNVARVADVDVVQNNALAFSGNNAVLILSRYRPAAHAEAEELVR